MNLSTAKGQIIFVDSSVQDYQTLIQNIDAAQIFILNENLSAIGVLNKALVILNWGVYKNNLSGHGRLPDTLYRINLPDPSEYVTPLQKLYIEQIKVMV